MISDGMKWWFKKNGCQHVDSLNLTAWQAYTVRRLVEVGVRMETALSYGKNQALAVLASYEKRGMDDGSEIPQ